MQQFTQQRISASQSSQPSPRQIESSRTARVSPMKSLSGCQPSASPRYGQTRCDGSVAGLSHDVRNMIAALNLYCDLLSEPAVLAPSHRHYADDLRLVAQAGSSLLERLTRLTPPRLQIAPAAAELLTPGLVPDYPAIQTAQRTAVQNLATELESCQKLLAALAGPSIRVTLDTGFFTGPLPLSSEDLTRTLMNLVGNACQAMPDGGHIRIAVRTDAAAESIVLSVQDDGMGITPSGLEHLFESGYTTRRGSRGTTPSLPGTHGLGLAIVRGLVESAGGGIRALSPPRMGARFEMTFPAAPALTQDAAVKITELREGSRVQC